MFTNLGAIAYSNARFGSSTGPIYLDDVRCTGFESNLYDCVFDSNTRDCSHQEDASIRCTPRGHYSKQS